MFHLRGLAVWLPVWSTACGQTTDTDAIEQTANGLGRGERHDVPGHIEAEDYAAFGGSLRTSETVRYEVGQGRVLQQISDGARTNYGVRVAESGRYALRFRYAHGGYSDFQPGILSLGETTDELGKADEGQVGSARGLLMAPEQAR